jgi:exosortase H (IPTLxxWG-CTERM-specific)
MKSNLFTPLAVIYAKLSGLFLNIMGEHIVVSSDLISSAKFSLQVKRGCDAMEPMVVFIAGVIAFPASYKDKLKGLGVGLSIIFFLNILRIISLYYTGIFFPAFFEMMHVEVWQVLFIIIAITFWFKWLQWLMAKRS